MWHRTNIYFKNWVGSLKLDKKNRKMRKTCMCMIWKAVWWFILFFQYLTECDKIYCNRAISILWNCFYIWNLFASVVCLRNGKVIPIEFKNKLILHFFPNQTKQIKMKTFCPDFKRTFILKMQKITQKSVKFHKRKL